MINALSAECPMTVESVMEVEHKVPAVDLRAAREQRGLSLERIAADTKIPRSLLEALERRDFRQFPPGIYARAYARAYAKAVGLSPDAVLAALADRLPGEESLQQIAQAKPGSIGWFKRLVGRDRAGQEQAVLLLLMTVTSVLA